MTWTGQKLPGGNEHNFAVWLRNAFFAFLRLKEGRTNFNIDDPIPQNDEEYGPINSGLFTIFDAPKHDPGYNHTRGRIVDLVADGNVVLHRACLDQHELSLKRRGVGRPKPKRRQRSVKEKHCTVVSEQQDGPDLFMHRTEGIYGTFNMARSNPEIIHLSEMLNAECLKYKVASINEIARNHKVRVFCHDCGCSIADQFEGHLCALCFVDAWHVKKHKCDKSLYDPKHANNKHLFETLDLNSEFAEQSWRRFNKFAAITNHMCRSHFRCFLRHLCIWRNKFVKGRHTGDIVKYCFSFKRSKQMKRMLTRRRQVLMKLKSNPTRSRRIQNLV